MWKVRICSGYISTASALPPWMEHRTSPSHGCWAWPCGLFWSMECGQSCIPSIVCACVCVCVCVSSAPRPLEASDLHQEKNMNRVATYPQPVPQSEPCGADPQSGTNSSWPADPQMHTWCRLCWLTGCLFMQHYCNKSWSLWRVQMASNFYYSPNARTRHLDIVLWETSKEKPFIFFIFYFLAIKFIYFILFFICSEFCHTLKWNSHGFTCVPHPDPPRNHFYLVPHLFLKFWPHCVACGIIFLNLQPPILGAWNLNHWTTKEVLSPSSLKPPFTVNVPALRCSRLFSILLCG